MPNPRYRAPRVRYWRDQQTAGAGGLPGREEMARWAREAQARQGVGPAPTATPGPPARPVPTPTPPQLPAVTPQPRRSQAPRPRQPVPTGTPEAGPWYRGQRAPAPGQQPVNPMELPSWHPERQRWLLQQRANWLENELRQRAMPWQQAPAAPANYRPLYRWFDPRYIRPHEPQLWEPPAFDIPDYAVVEA